MENQWQPKTRGGWPVKITGLIADLGLYVLEGEVTCSDGGKMIMTWTKDGQHVYGKESTYDLMPQEAPVDPPLDPAKVQARNRMVLALAATQYKRACDAEEAAHAAERKTLGELNVRLQDFGGTAVIRIDGEIYRVAIVDDYEVEFIKIEVL